MTRNAYLLALGFVLASCTDDPATTTDVPSTTDIPVIDIPVVNDTPTADRADVTDTGQDVVTPTDVATDVAADATDATATDAADATATDATDATTDVTTDVTASDGGDAGAMDASAPMGLVVNEIRASGDDWIELYNNGTTTIDMGGYRIADTDTDAGLPRLAQAVQLPAGTTLAPGAYLFILADQSDAGTGPQTSCLDGGPTQCFHAPWGISASRGETISIVNALNVVVLQGVYPANAVVSGQSYGRLPNGTGGFTANRPTPGAANAAP